MNAELAHDDEADTVRETEGTAISGKDGRHPGTVGCLVDPMDADEGHQVLLEHSYRGNT